MLKVELSLISSCRLSAKSLTKLMPDWRFCKMGLLYYVTLKLFNVEMTEVRLLSPATASSPILERMSPFPKGIQTAMSSKDC